MAKVSVDPELCIGTGECWRLLPGAFKLDESRGVSMPLPAAESIDRALLEEAVFNCPTRAISLALADR